MLGIVRFIAGEGCVEATVGSGFGIPLGKVGRIYDAYTVLRRDGLSFRSEGRVRLSERAAERGVGFERNRQSGRTRFRQRTAVRQTHHRRGSDGSCLDWSVPRISKSPSRFAQSVARRCADADAESDSVSHEG